MRASKQKIKENKQKNPSLKKGPKAAELRSEILLNVAFDRLNRCKSRLYAVPGEISDIMSDSLKCGVDVYQQALVLYRAGRYADSASFAKAVTQFCNLLNNIADENADNILKLPLPPGMKLEKTEKTASSDMLHPSLKILDSLIRKKLTKASRFYKSRLEGYHETIREISKSLSRLENYH